MQQDSQSTDAVIDEELSALADGEVSESEACDILSNLALSESSYRLKLLAWKRIHLIGSMLRKEPNSFLDLDISEQVHAAVLNEPKTALDSDSFENTSADSVIDEVMSAFADGEADDQESSKIFSEITSNSPEKSRYLNTWKKIHLMGSLIRKEPNPFLDMDISSQVSAAIASEPQPVSSAAELNFASGNTVISEEISALADGEASELEVRRILKSMSSDGDANKEGALAWKRIHLMGSLMRDEQTPFLDVDISSRVSEALLNEASPAPKSFMTKWLEAAGKTGIAAAVAVGVLLGVQQFPSQDLSTEVYAGESGSGSLQPNVRVGAQAPEWFQPQPLAARVASVSSNGETDRRYESRKEVLSYFENGPANQRSGQLVDPEVYKYLEQLSRAHADRAASVNSLKVVPLARAGSDDSQ